MINHELIIDLNSYSDKILCTFQQGESGGRLIYLNVTENGIGYHPLPNHTTYKLQIDKPDGTTVMVSTSDTPIVHNRLSISSETPLRLAYRVGKNTCAVDGILHCKLSIMEGNVDVPTLKSVMFKIRVAAGVKREEDIVSTSEYQRFEDFIDKIDSINEKVTKYENHVSNKLNPHQVTASQVGTYTSQEIDNKIQTAMNSTNFADGRIYSRNSVNMNRKADTTTGSYSFSFGSNNEASGDYSHQKGSERKHLVPILMQKVLKALLLGRTAMQKDNLQKQKLSLHTRRGKVLLLLENILMQRDKSLLLLVMLLIQKDLEQILLHKVLMQKGITHLQAARPLMQKVHFQQRLDLLLTQKDMKLSLKEFLHIQKDGKQ